MLFIKFYLGQQFVRIRLNIILNAHLNQNIFKFKRNTLICGHQVMKTDLELVYSGFIKSLYILK
jgi:hypothetical protein